MSGGSLNYFYSTLEEHAGDFADKELDDLVRDLAELFHAREWYLSGDTGEGDWREARDEFKAKWFTHDGRNERMEKYINQTVDELREMLGISRKRCKNCQHWTAEDDSYYGRCEYHEHCLMHRAESCERWEDE